MRARRSAFNVTPSELADMPMRGSPRRQRTGNRERNRNEVVRRRPRQVLSHDALRRARNDDCLRDRTDAGREQDSVAVCAREIGAVGRRNRHRGSGETRHVVDAVADHRNVHAALGEFAHVRELRLRCCVRAVRNAQAFRQRASGFGAIAGADLCVYAETRKCRQRRRYVVAQRHPHGELGDDGRHAMRVDRCEIERGEVGM